MSPETIQQSPETRESRYTARTIGQVAELDLKTKLINFGCYLYSRGFPGDFFGERMIPWFESTDLDEIKHRIDTLLATGTRQDWNYNFTGYPPFTDVQWKIIHEVQARYKVQQIIFELSEDNHLLVQENRLLKKALTAMGVSASIIILYLAYNLYREKNTSEESTLPRSKILDIPEPLPEGTTFAIL